MLYARHSQAGLRGDRVRAEAPRVEQDDPRPTLDEGRCQPGRGLQSVPLGGCQEHGLPERAWEADEAALELRRRLGGEPARHQVVVDALAVGLRGVAERLDLDLVRDVGLGEVVDDHVEREQRDGPLVVHRHAGRPVLTEREDATERRRAHPLADRLGERPWRNEPVFVTRLETDVGRERPPVRVGAEAAERGRPGPALLPDPEHEALLEQVPGRRVEELVADRDGRERLQREPADLRRLQQRREGGRGAGYVRR